MGTARMSARAQDGVCNQWGQTHDIPNLFISDGSQFTTGGAETPRSRSCRWRFARPITSLRRWRNAPCKQGPKRSTQETPHVNSSLPPIRFLRIAYPHRAHPGGVDQHPDGKLHLGHAGAPGGRRGGYHQHPDRAVPRRDPVPPGRCAEFHSFPAGHVPALTFDESATSSKRLKPWKTP